MLLAIVVRETTMLVAYSHSVIDIEGDITYLLTSQIAWVYGRI